MRRLRPLRFAPPLLLLTSTFLLDVGADARASTLASPPLAFGAVPARAAPSRVEWESFVDAERGEELAHLAVLDHRANRGRPPTGPRPPAPPSALDLVSRVMDVDVDPTSRAVTAYADLKIRAVGDSIAEVGLSVADGLDITAATLDGVPAKVNAIVTPQGFRYAIVELPSLIATNAQGTLRVTYGGTVSCGKGEDSCSLSPDFARFTTGSIWPYVFDATGAQQPFDGATTELTLRVPLGNDVVVSADKVSTRTEGNRLVTEWRVPLQIHHAYGFYAFIGKLSIADVGGRTVATRLVSPVDGSPNDAKLLGWSAGVLSFVEKTMGGPLPFASQWLVRLPKTIKDPGTVSYGMTLLNDSYGTFGDLVYEETWAHENAHLAWAITVPEPEALRTRMLTEGLATFTEIDFSKKFFPSEDWDDYLARRYQNIRLDWETRGGLGKLAPVVASEAVAAKLLRSQTREYSGWAYEKSAATLDHFRAMIGDDAFASALATYAKQYAFKGASVDEFRALLETASGQNLKPAFARWVTGSARPEVKVSLQRNTAGFFELIVEKPDADPFPMTFIVTDMAGKTSKLTVALSGASTVLSLQSFGEVYTARPNPRLGVLSKLQSATPGDLDYDSEVDGKDLLRCASKLGANSKTAGLWGIGEGFPVECDLDENGTIDEADLSALETSFGGAP